MPVLRSLIGETTGSSMLGAGAEVASGIAMPMIMGGSGGSQPNAKPRSRGWYRESYRHSLAARGVSTSYRIGGGPNAVPETPIALVRNEVMESTKIPPDWKLDRCGYTGDKLENDMNLYEIWSVVFFRDRDGEQVRYFYVVKSKRKDKDTYGDPEVVDRFDHYEQALDWLGYTRQGKITKGERP